MTDQKKKPAAAGKPASQLDPLRNVPRVAEPAPVEGERTPDGRRILRDGYGRAYTSSSPQTGGIVTYLDEAEYPVELPEGESAPPALKVTPVQAAATAASAFEPAPPEELDPRAALQTSTMPPIATEVHAAPAAGVASFSATQVTAAQAAAPQPAPPEAVQKVIDATLAHPSARPAKSGTAQPGGAK